MGSISVRDRLPRDVMWILALASLASSVAIVVVFGLGADSHAYWLVWQGQDSLYDHAPTEPDAYLYSPAFAQAVWPLAQLPFPVFCAAFTIAPAVAFWWLLRPLPARLAVPFWLMTTPEIVTGNVFWLLALCAVWGLRRPSWWLVAALTKITPFLGPVWFAIRREWARLAISIVATTCVAAGSYALDPGAWHDWVAFLLQNQSGSQGPIGDALPLTIRVPAAVLLVVWGAVTDRVWVLPAGMVLATPVLAVASFTVLAALPRLKSDYARALATGTSTVSRRE